MRKSEINKTVNQPTLAENEAPCSICNPYTTGGFVLNIQGLAMFQNGGDIGIILSSKAIPPSLLPERCKTQNVVQPVSLEAKRKKSP